MNNFIENNRFEVLTPKGFKDFNGVKITKNNLYKLTTIDGLELKCTENHIFISEDFKEVKLSDLNVNDGIKTVNGISIIKDIIDLDEVDYVYDLVDVDDGNLYYTNDITSHNCAFIGSGDNVIDANVIQEQEKVNVIDPIRKENKDQTWVWKDPEDGHRYILGLDVSRGDSDDKTAIVVIDFDTWEQVLEFHGHTRPDAAAELAVEYAKRYKAYIVLDLTGMGLASAIKLKDSDYPAKLCYYEGLKDSELFGGPPADKFPGLNFGRGNVRNQIVSAIEEGWREGFKIRSKRMIVEANKFVFINGKADHVKGAHDDLLMALGMCLHIANIHFNKLIKNNNSTKAMINSWKVETSQVKSPVEVDQFKSVSHQNKRVQALIDKSVNKHLNNTRYNTEQYGWIFGVKGMMRKKR